MNHENIAVIVEGNVREPDIIADMASVFFKNRVKMIPLPAGSNIYMLWKRLSEDDYETDIIEVVREDNSLSRKVLEGYRRDDFSEVYLFFDYDGHQTNIGNDDGKDGDTVIREMLQTFNNETDQGKLYISYPMVEALRDYTAGECAAPSGCFLPFGQFGRYKHLSGYAAGHPQFKKYTFSEWEEICCIFGMRISCLFGSEQTLTFSGYRENVTPESVFEQERSSKSKNDVFVLSAFPEFLLDYYPENFWRKMVKRSTNLRNTCRQSRKAGRNIM